MRRSFLVFLPIVGLVTAVMLGLRLSSQTAADMEASPVPAVATPLPISQVVLFSSGVGYFQREGEVQGNARVDLTFPVQDINDLLKSMVLEDQGGGHISAVNYDSQAPVEKTLRSFAINLTSNPSFGQILNQTRGEKVEVTLQSTPGSRTLSGVVMGVEQKKEVNGKETVEGGFVNLWCAEGMRSVKLSDVQNVRFLNPVLDSEVKKALEVLAMSHDTQKKAVSLNCLGEGKRTVKVGYVVENPIWKTTYRLVLDKTGKPYLQGWAIVENTQDEDWNNVHMALISGRPISFQMDLYQPLSVARPVVEPELFASLRPPTYSGALGKPLPSGGVAGIFWNNQPAYNQIPASPAMPVAVASSPTGSGNASAGFGLLRPETVAPPPQEIDPRRGAASAAAATELGDFFQYQIEHPVNLPRQKSALLPIVSEQVEGSRVSIYNEATHAKFPLLGLRFKNTTKLHLMQGPITVFDNNNYAGDARILDLQPNEERLLSYAIDLGVEVEPVVREPKEHLVQVKIVQGVLLVTGTVRESKRYTIKNRTEHDRTVLIEHPYRPQFTLVAPATASERARDVYRFEVPVDAGKTGQCDVIEDHEQISQMTIASIDDETVRLVVGNKVTSAKVKKAVARAVELKTMLGQKQQEIATKQQRLKEIGEDQSRLRANLEKVPPTSDAYKRYLKKFDTQETEIEQLQEAVKQLQDQERTQQKEYDSFLAELNVE